MTTFSDNLAEYREQAHISRKELAKLLGVSVASIGFYETGNYSPYADYFLNKQVERIKEIE